MAEAILSVQQAQLRTTRTHATNTIVLQAATRAIKARLRRQGLRSLNSSPESCAS
jgi:hypothetical protein